MIKPKRYKNIYGDENRLRKIALAYPDNEPRFLSDEYHYVEMGVSRRGYVKNIIRIKDGPITHISLLLNADEWKLFQQSFKVEKRVGGWRLKET